MNWNLIALTILTVIALAETVWLFISLKKKPATPGASPKKATLTAGAFIQKMLSEDNGNPSTMRFNVTYMVVAFVSVITYGFIYVVRNHSDLIVTYLTVIVASVNAALGLKIWQKKNEKPGQPDPTIASSQQEPHNESQ